MTVLGRLEWAAPRGRVGIDAAPWSSGQGAVPAQDRETYTGLVAKRPAGRRCYKVIVVLAGNAQQSGAVQTQGGRARPRGFPRSRLSHESRFSPARSALLGWGAGRGAAIRPSATLTVQRGRTGDFAQGDREVGSPPGSIANILRFCSSSRKNATILRNLIEWDHLDS